MFTAEPRNTIDNKNDKIAMLRHLYYPVPTATFGFWSFGQCTATALLLFGWYHSADER